jgi:putative heme-binding domain-containing protein
VGPKGGKDGKQYVPKTRDVLFSTDMVQANQSTRLTFDVPRKPGEYPFVCTFPQHWSRMYGVMVVVKDLDKWMKNPKEPVDPIGNTRQLVKKWTVDDFKDDFKTDLSVRSVEAGKQVFTQATCAQCHKVGGEGGIGSNVGPALDEVYSRWKGDRAAVIREILDPSANIDEKYAMHTVATDDGMVRSGIIIKQTKDMIELVESAAVTEVTKIPMDEVEDMAKSSTSIMPKALLDNFSKEEILDLIRYLEASQTMEARQTKD